MIVEIAIGTTVGVLAAAIIMAAAYRWYLLAKAPETWPTAKSYLTMFIFIVAFPVLLWFLVPIIQDIRHHAAEAERRAVAEKEQIEQEMRHCRVDAEVVMREAATARSKSPFRKGPPPAGAIWSFAPSRSAYGWLILCRTYGIISEADFDKVVERQRKHQEEYEAKKSTEEAKAWYEKWKRELDEAK